VRKATTSPVCTFVAARRTGLRARGRDGGLHGFTSRSDVFQGDSSDFYVDWDGAWGVTFHFPDLQEGNDEPSPTFTLSCSETAHAGANIHIQGRDVHGRNQRDDTDLPAQGPNIM